MSSEHSAITQSLQEIASLLLFIHDYYLQEVYGKSNILLRLLSLLEDSKLNTHVHVLVAERYRRLAMKTNDHMGYELFYDWLRYISQYVYGFEEDKKSLHFLLVNYLIPFATTINASNSKQISSVSFNTSHNHVVVSYIDAFLKSILDFDDFLVTWFFQLYSKKDHVDVNVTSNVWSQLLRYKSVSSNQSDFETSPIVIPISAIYKELLSMKIIDTLINIEEWKDIIHQVTLITNYNHDSPIIETDTRISSTAPLTAATNTTYHIEQITFVDFLLIIQFIVLIQLNKHAKNTKNQALNYNEQIHLEVLSTLKFIASCKLSNIFNNFIVNGNSKKDVLDDFTKNGSDLSSQQNLISYITDTSLLWLMRQCGLLCFPHIEWVQLINQIEIFSVKITKPLTANDYEETSVKESVWYLEDIPSILSKLIDKLTGIHMSISALPASSVSTLNAQNASNVSDYKLSEMFSNKDKCHFYLLKLCPFVFFTNFKCSTHHLQSYYTITNALLMNSIQLSHIDKFVECIDRKLKIGRLIHLIYHQSYLSSFVSPSPDSVQKNGNSSKLLYISLASLQEFLALRYVFPYCLTKSMFIDLCHNLTNYIATESPGRRQSTVMGTEESSGIMCKLPVATVMEIIYVIAQIAHENIHIHLLKDTLPPYLQEVFRYDGKLIAKFAGNDEIAVKFAIFRQFLDYVITDPVEQLENYHSEQKRQLAFSVSPTPLKEIVTHHPETSREKRDFLTPPLPVYRGEITDSIHFRENHSNIPDERTPNIDRPLTIEVDITPQFSPQPSPSQHLTDSDGMLQKILSTHSIRDTYALLVHYPVVSFSFNPWELMTLFQTILQQSSHVRSNIKPPIPSKSRAQHTVEFLETNEKFSSSLALKKILFSMSYQYNISHLQLVVYLYEFSLNLSKSTQSENTHSSQDISINEYMISSISIFKIEAMRSKVLNLLFCDRSLKLIFFNSNLLRYEYSRCIIRFKTIASDPFTDHIIQPFISNVHINAFPSQCILSSNTALQWAIHTFHVSKEEAEIHLLEVLCIAGKISRFLTFSTFIIFAIRCFTGKLFKKNSSTSDYITIPDLSAFLAEIRSMLHVFSYNLTNVQQIIRIRVLNPLYQDEMGNFLDVREKRMVILSAYDIFRQHIALCNRSKTSNTAPTSLHLPPRPPDIYLDAPRFLHFCSYFGIFSRYQLTLEVVWCAFGLMLQSNSPKYSELWDRKIVPPLPIELKVENLLLLFEKLVIAIRLYSLNSIVAGSEEENNQPLTSSANDIDWQLYYKTLLPMLCAITDLRIEEKKNDLTKSNERIPEYPVFEDILRFGGSELFQGMSYCKEFLKLCFNALVKKSNRIFKSPLSVILPAEDSHDDMRILESIINAMKDPIPFNESYEEVSLNLACSFFTCFGALKTGTVAMQAKKALHNRIRPILINKNTSVSSKFESNGKVFSTEIVTLCYSEFEELFVRCAYALYTQSNAPNTAKKVPTVSHLLQTSSYIANTNNNPLVLETNRQIKSILSEYVVDIEREVKAKSTKVVEYNRINNNSGGISHNLKPQQMKKCTWGVNFVTSYGHILEMFTDLVIDHNELIAKRTRKAGELKGILLEHKSVTDQAASQTMLETFLEIPYDATIISSSAAVSGAVFKMLSPEETNELQTLNAPRISFLPSKSPSKSSSEVIAKASSFDILNDIINNSKLTHTIADPASRFRKSLEDHPYIKEVVLNSKSKRTEIKSELADSPLPGRLSHSLKSSATSASASASTISSSSPYKLRGSKEVLSSSRERFQMRQESTEQFVIALDELLKGTKEALWPVFATYCSCGDSTEPGKLSGPNLFTLLSKLGVLTDNTLLSEVGLLLHQISTHSFSSAFLSADLQAGEEASVKIPDLPALTFEEFLVFLCAFSQLRYEGTLANPNDTDNDMISVASGSSHRSMVSGSHHPQQAHDNWFKKWQSFMASSKYFRRLLQDCVLPILQKQMLLAFPEDARYRDRMNCIFSTEVLRAIEMVEGPLQVFFEYERHVSLPANRVVLPRRVQLYEVEIFAILSALKRIHLVPSVISEQQVLQLIADVTPEVNRGEKTQSVVSHSFSALKSKPEYLSFPMWEWVLSVVAFQAVDTAVQQSQSYMHPKRISTLVADVLSSIASAMTQSQLHSFVRHD